MRSKRLWLAVVAGALGVLVFATVAVASATLDDGEYTLALPGVGDFEFTIDSGAEVGSDTVVAVAAPEGYAVDDDDPDKAAWKTLASLEVEVKSDKVEADYDWTLGDATLSLPDGGTITVAFDGASMTVTAGGGWYAFGNGTDWYVANADDVNFATKFFKVEANDSGVELKPTGGVDDGFLNELEEDEDAEEEDEAAEEEAEVEAEDSEGDNNAGGNGRGKP
jgi:hypothetical protein